MRRNVKIVACMLSALMFTAGAASGAIAKPRPPTNAGNGAGKSGQCTGSNKDRPASCKSRGGPGNRP